MLHSEIQKIQTTIATLEAQRTMLGDAIVDTALAPLRQKLSTLTKASSTHDELKRVTILFADVSNFTRLSEVLDPEKTAALMNQLFDVLTPIITRNGGTIDKYSGDAVMAVFGAPLAMESHEEMALRTAVTMQTAVAHFNQELQQSRDIHIRLRIGLNTGEVMVTRVGGGDDKRFTVMGDAVNLAAHLEQACPIGRVMISAATARYLHNLFDFESPRQITVKGRIEPVTVYVVIGEKAEQGSVRGLTGLHAPMIGREAEMASLQEQFTLLLREKAWQAVAVTGEPGIGKTRLRREFVAWVAANHPQVRILSARGFAHTQLTTYHLVAELLQGLFGVEENVAAATAVTDITHRLQTFSPDLSETEKLYQLGSIAQVLGLHLPDDPLTKLDPKQRRDRTFLSLERILLAASSQTPLLIIIEDIHWADALSLDLLQRLLDRIENNALEQKTAFLLLTSRLPDEEPAPYAQLLGQLTHLPHETILLTPLSPFQSRQLVRELLAQPLLATLNTIITEHSQGNPLFVEEILRTFIEDGTLLRDSRTGTWQLTRTVAELRVPTTVQGLLAARLDRLDPEYKQLLQHAAVIGRLFWQPLLLALVAEEADGETAAHIDDTLQQLQNRQLISRQKQSQIADDWEWAFAHVLIQEVAYHSLPKTRRQEIHRRVGQWLESQMSRPQERQVITALLPLIAYHYEKGQRTAQAVQYLQQAGEYATSQFANQEAVDYFSRAINLLATVEFDQPEYRDEQRYQLLLGREAVYNLTAEREKQAADLVLLQKTADKLNNHEYRVEGALRFAAYYEAISDFSAALFAAKEAVKWADEAGSDHLLIKGLDACGLALWRQGAFREARTYLQQALDLVRREEAPADLARILHSLGTVLNYLGEHQIGRDYLEQALTIRRQLGDLRGEAISLNNLVSVYYSLGDFLKAKVCCEEALNIHRTVGHPRVEADTLTNLAGIHHLLGNLATAREHHMQALALYWELKDRNGESLASNNLALVLYDLAEYRLAQEYARRAVSVARNIGDKEGEGFALTALGLALEGLEQWGAATQAYEDALAIRRQIGQEGYAVDDLAGLARVAWKQANLEEAAQFIDEAMDWIGQHGVQGIEYPLRVCLTAYEVLWACGRENEAQGVLVEAHTLLQDQAAEIGDEAAQAIFLEKVPVHNQLCHYFQELVRK